MAEGEGTAFLGGMLAHRALIPWVEVAAAAASGAFVADQVCFRLGRQAGRFPFLQRRLDGPAGQRLQALLARHPHAVAFGFRFIPGTRVVGPLAMGAAGMHPLPFLAMNALAAVIWGAVVTGLGYHFGAALHALAGPLHILLALAIGAAALAAATLLIRKLWRV